MLTELIQAVNNPSPLVWCIEHLSAVGWPAIVFIAWKVSGYFKGLTDQANKTVAQVDKMATNCFPTMQASLLKQDDLLHSMDGSLKILADGRTSDDRISSRKSAKRKTIRG